MHLSCPIASRFIDTREDALAYYEHKFVGEHKILVTRAARNVVVVVVFNQDEIHHFTDDRTPCPAEDIVARNGRTREVRCFSRQRARMMDEILPTIANPVAVKESKIRGGAILFGPPHQNSQRLAVVVGADAGGRFFVRTAYLVSPKDFAAAQRNKARPWP
jgi:hypothetical protein